MQSLIYVFMRNLRNLIIKLSMLEEFVFVQIIIMK